MNAINWGEYMDNVKRNAKAIWPTSRVTQAMEDGNATIPQINRLILRLRKQGIVLKARTENVAVTAPEAYNEVVKHELTITFFIDGEQRYMTTLVDKNDKQAMRLLDMLREATDKIRGELNEKI